MVPRTQKPIEIIGRLISGPIQQALIQTRRKAAVSSGLQQCRRLHLYKTARATTIVGMQKIVGFEDYRVALPSASQHVVDVVEETGNTVVAQGISLEELYDKHVKPGHMLYLTQKVDKGMAENVKKMRKEQVAQWTNKFAIAQPYSGRVKNTGKQLGGLKYIMITLANPVTHVRLVLDRAYQFIANGSPVEFQIRLKVSYTK